MHHKSTVHLLFLVPAFRTRYYQEAQEGLYSGPLFLLSYWLLAVPFAVISVGAATRITFLWVLSYIHSVNLTLICRVKHDLKCYMLKTFCNWMTKVKRIERL
jgi:hypothetical protein